jgi:uncharacterized protein (DUF433 family)
MGKVVSVRLTDEQIARLDRAASTSKTTQAEMAAVLVEEALRLSEFPFIQFRDWGVGREAFLAGTRLRVWWIVTLVDAYEGDVAKAADHIEVREREIRAALAYAAAFPDEIEAAIEEHRRAWEQLPHKLPKLETFRVDLTPADAPAP